MYKKLKNNIVQCQTCSHFCVISPGKKGICQVRQNKDGELFVLNYGKTPGIAIDPIEKKPLQNFMPNTQTLSFNAVGCNFKCLHCQNFWTSQANEYELRIMNYELREQKITPQEIVQAALDHNCPSISYTYTEPTIFLEYALDTMKLAKKENLKNIWVSNGYMSDQTLKLITPCLDAINVDLKSFSEKFYKQICQAKLQPVLDNLVKIKKLGIHLEITTLIIPTKNDSPQELEQIAEFISKKLSKDTAWHITGFYPTYKLNNLPPTPPESIFLAKKIGEQTGLKYVYAYI
ncbi:MAG: AmmeMemoRadiSam system radical SAM enzyme [Patescibacteria group bacterium]